jgi:hypothetical protein
MTFNNHSEFAGKHAFLSASKYHWINYSLEKLDNTYRTALAAAKGTELHEFAFQAIKLGIKLPRSQKTLNMYVNDAIGFRMTPEQILFYSGNCFGTADAISFRNNFLRIHDLKTGVTPTSMKQLEVYTAMFCLEYGYKPYELDIELRIYQNDEVVEHVPEVDDIAHIMDKIITFDKQIEILKAEALS